MAARIMAQKQNTHVANKYVVKLVLTSAIKEQAKTGAVSLVCKQEYSRENFLDLVFSKLSQILPPSLQGPAIAPDGYYISACRNGKPLPETDYYLHLAGLVDKTGQVVTLYLVKCLAPDVVRIKAPHLNTTFQLKASSSTTIQQLLDTLATQLPKLPGKGKENQGRSALSVTNCMLGRTSAIAEKADAIVLKLWETGDDCPRQLFLIPPPAPNVSSSRAKRKMSAFSASRPASGSVSASSSFSGGGLIHKFSTKRWSTLTAQSFSPGFNRISSSSTNSRASEGGPSSFKDADRPYTSSVEDGGPDKPHTSNEDGKSATDGKVPDETFMVGVTPSLETLPAAGQARTSPQHRSPFKTFSNLSASDAFFYESESVPSSLLRRAASATGELPVILRRGSGGLTGHIKVTNIPRTKSLPSIFQSTSLTQDEYEWLLRGRPCGQDMQSAEHAVGQRA
eukprot:gb/GEZN01006990.1/.p1 GENE.gb/GEZN01006990.1/~~gb/GEZN01006990.1/.p1  ORF type:complete len:452 (-),score=66.69 gb/GEZN01006990.1/:117-1472(-)